MQPQGMLSQLNQSMMQGQPELNQISTTSPAGQPGLQAPIAPGGGDRNYTLIHSAAARRGMNLAGHPQLQPQPAMAPQPGQPSPADSQVEMPVSEAELIIKALSTRLKTLSGHEEKLRDTAIKLLVPETEEAVGATSQSNPQS